jgi:integrase
MATIRKRGKRWRAEVWVGGKRRGSTHLTKAEAAAWALEQERHLRTVTGSAPLHATLGDLLAKYRREVSPKKRSARWEMQRLEALCADPVAGVALADLGPPHLAAWRDRRLAAVSAATVRRDLNLLSHALRIAWREWHWLASNPLATVSRPPEPPARDRRVTAEEIERLRLAGGEQDDEPIVTATQRVSIAFRLAIETAMRAGELVGLTWDRVDLGARVATLPKTKNGTARRVPLSTAAVTLLERLPKGGATCLGLTGRQLDALFRKCRDRAGIVGLHFHDSRHEAITRLAQRLDVLDLARMVGHRDLKMLQAYYNASAEEIAGRLG